MSLSTIPREQLDYLTGATGLPSQYHYAARCGRLEAAVDLFLDGIVERKFLAESRAITRWYDRAESVSSVVRQSYIAELRAAA